MANYSKSNHVLQAEQGDLESSWCGGSCFGFMKPRHGSRYNHHQETRVLLKQNNNDEEDNGKESWLVNELKNLKEFSEGWRNGCSNWRRSKGNTKIQCVYSPESYALNFDDDERRRLQGEEEEGFINFQSRPGSRPL